MMNIINFIVENPFITIFLSALTIIGFIITYKSTPQKKLKLIISDNELITNKQTDFSKLNIFYDGNNVDKLTVTKITLWNASFSPIRNSDIAKTAPLSITINGGDILDVSVLKGQDTANQIYIEKTDNCPYCICFEYLNRKEGGLIQVIHTSGTNSINVSRKLIGGKVVISKNPNSNFLNALLLSAVSTAVAMIGSFLVAVLEIYFGIPDVIAIISYFISLIALLMLMLFFLTKEYIPKNCK